MCVLLRHDDACKGGNRVPEQWGQGQCECRALGLWEGGTFVLQHSTEQPAWSECPVPWIYTQTFIPRGPEVVCKRILSFSSKFKVKDKYPFFWPQLTCCHCRSFTANPWLLHILTQHRSAFSLPWWSQPLKRPQAAPSPKLSTTLSPSLYPPPALKLCSAEFQEQCLSGHHCSLYWCIRRESEWVCRFSCQWLSVSVCLCTCILALLSKTGWIFLIT